MPDPRFANPNTMIDWQKLVGKTIDGVDSDAAANIVILNFTDQTSVAVECEAIGHGLHTPVLTERGSFWGIRGKWKHLIRPANSGRRR